MRSNVLGLRTLLIAALAASSGIATYTASAQQTAPPEIGEITVEGARPGRSAIGAPINVVTNKRAVSYADISLTTPSGVKVLENRIRDAAKAACDELDRKYPVTAENSGNCFNNAVAGAMADARVAIESARRRAPDSYTAAIPAIQALEEVVVEGVSGRRSTSGAPIKDVMATRVVSFGDVSLTTASGVTVLENRIREAARSACNELEQKYPIAAEGDTTRKCIDNAVDSAMVVARRAVDAAKLASDTN